MKSGMTMIQNKTSQSLTKRIHYLSHMDKGLLSVALVARESSFKSYERKYLHPFFISDTFVSNATLKLAENQAKAKHHAGTELLKIIHILHFIIIQK